MFTLATDRFEVKPIPLAVYLASFPRLEATPYTAEDEAMIELAAAAPYEPSPLEEAEYLDLVDRDDLMAELAQMEKEAVWAEDARLAELGRELELLAREAGGWDRMTMLQAERMVG